MSIRVYIHIWKKIILFSHHTQMKFLGFGIVRNEQAAFTLHIAMQPVDGSNFLNAEAALSMCRYIFEFVQWSAAAGTNAFSADLINCIPNCFPIPEPWRAFSNLKCKYAWRLYGILNWNSVLTVFPSSVDMVLRVIYQISYITVNINSTRIAPTGPVVCQAGVTLFIRRQASEMLASTVFSFN